MDFWGWIKNFSKNDKWGDSNKVSPLLIFALDLIRSATKMVMIIHCAFDTQGHSEHSQHYKGLASDFHFTGCDPIVPLQKMLMVLKMLNVPFGIGFYKDWNNKGYHVDICRDKTTFWIHDDAGYHYFSDEQAFLKGLAL